MNILAQIAGVFAIFFWVTSIQKKEQYKILFSQILANIMYIIQYVILGTYIAAAMNFTSAVRCFVFYEKRKQNKDISIIWLFMFLILIILFAIFTYDNYLSLIPVILTLLYTISSWMKDSKWIRIVFLIAGIIWIYYNYSVGAYVSIVGNILEIVSAIVAIIKFKNIKEN